MSLSSKSVKELQDMARGNIKGFSTMRKAELIAALSKPKRKPKKIVKKTESVADFIKDILKFIQPKTTGTAFMPSPYITEYIFLKILDKYKNDCLLPRYDRFNKIFTPDQKVRRMPGQKGFTGFTQYTHTILTPNVISEIAKTYVKCQKNKKILLVPMTVSYFKGETHANLITFNTFTNTVEYFEPHGKGYNIKKHKSIDSMVEKLTEAVNAEFVKNKVDTKLKFSHAVNSCPVLPKAGKDTYNTMFGEQEAGVQGLQIQKRYRKFMLDGINFTGPGGFCTMWCFMQMEMRLKFPKLPENEISTKLLEMIKENPRKILDDLIFGYTNSFMADVLRIMGGAKNLKSFLDDPKGEQTKKLEDATAKVQNTIEQRILKQCCQK